MVSRITVFTTVPGGDFVLNAESLAALMGESSGSGIVDTPITTVGNGTLTAAALVGGQIGRTGPTGAFTDTTDTAANITAALGAQLNVGETFIARIKNATPYMQTLNGGAGVTFVAGTLVTPFSIATYFGTVGGTTAAPTVSFTPISIGPIRVAGEVVNPQALALNTVGAGVITAAGFEAGVTTRGGVQIAAFADTTDTAANIIAALPAFIQIGASVKWRYVNNTIFPATLGGGTGVTVAGATVVPANSWVEYLITYTAAATLTAVAIGQGYFPSTGTVTANAATPVVVTNAAVTANSNITLTYKSGAVGATGAFVEASTPGTGFSIKSVTSDTAVYNYEIRG